MNIPKLFKKAPKRIIGGTLAVAVLVAMLATLLISGTFASPTRTMKFENPIYHNFYTA